MTSDAITAREFATSEGTQEWPVLGDGATTFFRTPTFAAAAALVHAIAGLADVDDHPIDIDIRADGVTVRLVTYTDDYFGMSRRDLELAREISSIARDQGLRGDPPAVESIGPIVIGAVDIPAVMPFWAAILGYVPRRDSPAEDLVDPRGRGPGIWFEQISAEAAVGRPRMHVACWVPYEQAEARVQAAIAAGGRMVYDAQAPAWWTLADPEGNEADVATIKDRD
jgi:4a-hydroxytetrahydrobiopterin dehydratase